LDGEGGTTAGSVSTGGTSPNTKREGLESLVMKGRAGVRNAIKVCDSVLKTVWGRFVKAPQSGKEGRVVCKGPLEDGE
jgi:hypothetical protein